MRTGLTMLVLALMFSCNYPRFIANHMTGTLDDVKTVFFRERSPAHAEAAGPGLLMQLDGFIESAPGNEELLLRGAEMNCGYALTFLDHKDPDWARALYDKGLGYALRALEKDHEELAAAIRERKEEPLAKLLKKVDEDELPALFWTGLCWGSSINAKKEIDEIADLPMVEAVARRALALDERFYFGAGHLFFGMRYATMTRQLGGDPEKGRQSFEKGIAVTGGRFLLAKVMYAQTYCVSAQKPELYRKLLTEVMESDPAEDPAEMRLANAVSRQRARALMDEMEGSFPGWKPDTEDTEDDVEPLDPSELEDLD